MRKGKVLFMITAVCSALAAAGYKKVFDFGGINDWLDETINQNKSKPTEVRL